MYFRGKLVRDATLAEYVNTKASQSNAQRHGVLKPLNAERNFADLSPFPDVDLKQMLSRLRAQ